MTNIGKNLATQANTQVANKASNGFSAFMAAPAIREKINDIIGGKDGQRFITAIVSHVAQNPELQKCQHATLFTAAMQCEALKLSPSKTLGECYIIPFNDTKNNRVVATFQIGWQGYVQLALRSGQYRKLNVVELKEGEVVYYNRLTGDIETKFIEDDEIREKTPTMGYYAMFELTNGFFKGIYWSREKMEQHALKYSQGYAADKRKGTSYTFWSKSFDEMAKKTMIRQLIGKWGPKSLEMRQGLENDGAVIRDDQTPDYVDTIDAVSDVNYDPQTGEVLDAEPTQAEDTPKADADAEAAFFNETEENKQ